MNVASLSRLMLDFSLLPSLPPHPPAFGLDSEQPDYDMDSEDETLLNRLNRKMELKPLQFEVMVDRLEKASANQVTKRTFIQELQMTSVTSQYMEIPPNYSPIWIWCCLLRDCSSFTLIAGHFLLTFIANAKMSLDAEPKGFPSGVKQL